MTTIYTITLILAYILGAIPFAYIAGKWGKGIDLRQVGSGNLGFTNAWRELGWRLSLPVLLFDIAKGSLAVLMAWALAPADPWLPILSGLLAIIGHTWSVFLWFRGGKGVATSAGVFLTLMPIPFMIAFGVFIIMLAFTRIMSVASMTGAVALFVSAAVMFLLRNPYAPNGPLLLFAFLITTLIVARHRSNIRRLLQGAEPKMSQQQH